MTDGPRREAARRWRRDVWLVARRDLRERGRSRVFRIGTVVVLLVVAAAVVVPVLLHGRGTHVRVGVVGPVTGAERRLIERAGRTVGASVQVVGEADRAEAARALARGSIALAVVGHRYLLLDRALPLGAASPAALVTAELSLQLGTEAQLAAAGVPAGEAARLADPAPLPVHSLKPAAKNETTRNTAVYGLILVYVLLSQYCSWIMLGVIEEKSSRVIEVLLATIRPVQLLAGKVGGIGLLALGQAALLVGAALGLAAAVHSSLISGTAPVEVLAVLVWLVLGYALYCWVYAAAGSLAERTEHAQSLAFPLTLPMLVGYIVGLTQVTATAPSPLLEVLAYLPPTAPFDMPVLVAQGAVSWWQFLLACLLSLLAPAGMVRAATLVFSRAVLRTGRRVRLSEVLAAR